MAIVSSNIHLGGIDIIVMRGLTLTRPMAEVVTEYELLMQNVIQPDEAIERRLDIRQRPLRARIRTMSGS